jgi:hypothetical protein
MRSFSSFGIDDGMITENPEPQDVPTLEIPGSSRCINHRAIIAEYLSAACLAATIAGLDFEPSQSTYRRQALLQEKVHGPN